MNSLRLIDNKWDHQKYFSNNIKFFKCGHVEDDKQIVVIHCAQSVFI